MNIVKFNLAKLDINGVHIPDKTRELLKLPIEVELVDSEVAGYHLSSEFAKLLNMQLMKHYPNGYRITWFLSEELTILM